MTYFILGSIFNSGVLANIIGIQIFYFTFYFILEFENAFVKNILLELKEKEQENKTIFGCNYVNNDYIFKHDNGVPYHPSVVTRGFQRALKNAGLPIMRFHDLRHSTASILFDKGWDIGEVREWLRHADIDTTANIYTHVRQSRTIALGKNLNKTFTIKNENTT